MNCLFVYRGRFLRLPACFPDGQNRISRSGLRRRDGSASRGGFDFGRATLPDPLFLIGDERRNHARELFIRQRDGQTDRSDAALPKWNLNFLVNRNVARRMQCGLVHRGIYQRKLCSRWLFIDLLGRNSRVPQRLAKLIQKSIDVA